MEVYKVLTVKLHHVWDSVHFSVFILSCFVVVHDVDGGKPSYVTTRNNAQLNAPVCDACGRASQRHQRDG